MPKRDVITNDDGCNNLSLSLRALRRLAEDDAYGNAVKHFVA